MDDRTGSRASQKYEPGQMSHEERNALTRRANTRRSRMDLVDRDNEQGGGMRRNMTGMVRRRPMRSALIGAALAVGIGIWQARRRSSSRSENQYGWSGQEGGMAQGRGTREAKQQTLLAWLNDAYGMEKSMVQTLRNHAHAAHDRPSMQSRLERHSEESKEHAHMVRECIERLGGHVSGVKTGLSTMMGTVQGVVTAPAKDQIVKNILGDSAAERFEIASYQGIITAADEIGDTETAQVCRRILREEEQMLEWLEQQLPAAIRNQMAHA